MSRKPTHFDFWYAVNNTELLVLPTRHLETFGNTLINYTLVSELMDSVGQVRVREGRMQAMRPQIITPEAYSRMVLEGFGEQAEQYLEWLREHEDQVRVLRYGYTLKQEAFSEQVVTDSLENVLGRVKEAAADRKDPFCAVIKGVDTPWDVCLIRLFWQTVQNSAQANIRELSERHLFEMRDGIPMAVREEIDTAFAAAEKDATRVKQLGKLLQDKGVFEHYQDRFFSLVRRRGE
ncbi:MAG: hypothetical protein FJ222_06320 [Lentisphaerae bacterium]|nr:hypothetical protein [Lentisphaerota bacterium]